ncbi:gluconate kinase, SKI family [Candidatus Koribacter versatilis Ellin345]|uniref:Gluconokinase n=1 Tax=Koribacter versatilis (strain Ellin345) TaxID=204669 RepID=Q1IV53_KORVE|nr:gluconokinase [Candidatus Koribacter versatilis]ABF39247.1 gluconate kinase, SKI family [Candidatus Koribacter versatilis Ellin345]
MIILLMGVQGSGKTTVGKALAARLGWDFRDADEFHPAANKAKMAAGIPLTDEDREPWLQAIRAAMDRANAEHRNLVVTCSALKETYRQQLAAPNTTLVWLKGDQQLIASRLALREHHFAKSNLLASQFADLEEPQGAVAIDIHQTVEAIVDEIIRRLQINA